MPEDFVDSSAESSTAPEQDSIAESSTAQEPVDGLDLILDEVEAPEADRTEESSPSTEAAEEKPEKAEPKAEEEPSTQEKEETEEPESKDEGPSIEERYRNIKAALHQERVEKGRLRDKIAEMDRKLSDLSKDKDLTPEQKEAKAQEILDDPDGYLEKREKEKQQAQYQETVAALNRAEDKVREVYDDYDAVVYGSKVADWIEKNHPELKQEFMATGKPHEALYHFCKEALKPQAEEPAPAEQHAAPAKADEPAKPAEDVLTSELESLGLTIEEVKELAKKKNASNASRGVSNMPSAPAISHDVPDGEDLQSIVDG